MRLLQILAIFALYALSLLPGVRGDVTAGGKLRSRVSRIIVPRTLLTPHIPSSPRLHPGESEVHKREPTRIEGLLGKRQLTCPSGFGDCDNGGCCPLGGDCCTNDTCCPAGSICCSGGGCCRSSEYCVVDGCCPNGEICSGNSGVCDDAGFSPCPNDDYCCPTGQTCFRDSNNAAKCRSGGGAPPPPPPPPPPHTTTTTHKTTTATATHTSSFSIPSLTPLPTPPSPSPTPGIAETSVSYQVTDLRFTWTGDWIISTEGCKSSSRRTNFLGDSVTLNVSSATKIYLGLDCEDAKYDVFVNGQSTSFQSAELNVAEFCNYKQLYIGARLTNINVTIVLVEIMSSAKRQNSNLNFQINEVVAMDSTAAASGSNAVPSSNSATPPGSVSSATSLKTSWFHGFVAVLFAVGLGLAL